MQNARIPIAESVRSFELKASPDSPGMANLKINCLVSIPTGIRILALIDAEESKPENVEGDDGATGDKTGRGRKRRNGANLED